MRSRLLVIIHVLVVYTLIPLSSRAQSRDSLHRVFNMKGAVSLTNKGISFIPSFALGKPAAIFDLSLGKRKLFFEPQLRFSLEGKPWSFLFWWRYKLVNTNRFALTLGAHPALNFKTEIINANGTAIENIVTRRYTAVELAPNFMVKKNITVGLYYLYSRGLDEGTVRNTHFLTVNANFSNIPISNQLYFRFAPQVYYLSQDLKDGFYVTATTTVGKKNFPLSIQTILNTSIHTNIVSENFLWNVSLIYSFNNSYRK